MATVSELKSELDDILTLKLISSAFTEASAARIGRIKKNFEQNREFFEEISRIYHIVQMAQAKSQKSKIAGPGSNKKKTISVALTSNQRFYGNVNINIMTNFIEETKKSETELMIIGATGRDFMKSTGTKRPYELFMFARELPTDEEKRLFIKKTENFDRIIIYFPKFVSLVTQQVGVMDITAAQAPNEEIKDNEINFLFEPDLSEILEFFRKQVRQLLFVRVLLETDLARTAARLITMSGAEERSSDMLKVTKSQLRKIQSSIINAKLLETFSAMKGVKSKHN